MKSEELTRTCSGSSIEVLDDTKQGEPRVVIDTGAGLRLGFDASEVLKLRDWLDRWINVYEVEK